MQRVFHNVADSKELSPCHCVEVGTCSDVRFGCHQDVARAYGAEARDHTYMFACEDDPPSFWAAQKAALIGILRQEFTILIGNHESVP
jgi:hypothetical protein